LSIGRAILAITNPPNDTGVSVRISGTNRLRSVRLTGPRGIEETYPAQPIAQWAGYAHPFSLTLGVARTAIVAAPGYPVICTDAAGDLILTNESYLVRIGFHLIHQTRGALWRRAVQRVLIKNNGHAFLLMGDILAIAG